MIQYHTSLLTQCLLAPQAILSLTVC